MNDMSFTDHVNAIVYMTGESDNNARLIAWQEGPRLGALRFNYMQAHMLHIENMTESSGKAYAKAKNAFLDAYHGAA